MIPDDVHAKVEAIRRVAGDPEIAHQEEDRLLASVLHAIAEGNAVDPAQCARAALRTHDIAFARWYA